MRVPAPTLASQGFISCPSLYVKVCVIVLRHKPHVTFCHRDFLWFEPLGLKFCFDVGHSALAPVFWASSPQITPVVLGGRLGPESGLSRTSTARTVRRRGCVPMRGADADHGEIIPVQHGKNGSEQLGTHGGGRTARERRSFLLGELAATCSDLRPTEERTCAISGCSGAAKIVPD